jgi:NAD(P)-dependent dehydrogenase (short-subunit alcohol dehydrogenase family)
MDMSKVILITGCSSGIGHATAHFFADEDWNVVATMRHPENRETDLKGMENVDLIHLDVTDPPSIREAVRSTLEKHGRIDVLVNNAGYPVEGVFEAITEEQARKQFDTNVLGMMNVIREVLPVMRKQRDGIIVNVSSMGGKATLPLYSVYDSTKWAVEGLSEGLMYELRSLNIKVKVIEPGIIRTNFYDSSMILAKNEGLAEYDGFVEAAHRGVKRSVKQGSPPELVALCINKAVTDGTWKLRYHAGRYSGTLLALRRANPDRVFFWFLRRSALPKK